MLAVADDIMFSQAIEHLRQNFLALGERFLAKIMPIEVQQIEDELGQRMLCALFKRRLQIGKAALSVCREHHNLSVHNRAFDRKPA